MRSHLNISKNIMSLDDLDQIPEDEKDNVTVHIEE